MFVWDGLYSIGDIWLCSFYGSIPVQCQITIIFSKLSYCYCVHVTVESYAGALLIEQCFSIPPACVSRLGCCWNYLLTWFSINVDRLYIDAKTMLSICHVLQLMARINDMLSERWCSWKQAGFLQAKCSPGSHANSCCVLLFYLLLLAAVYIPLLGCLFVNHSWRLCGARQRLHSIPYGCSQSPASCPSSSYLFCHPPSPPFSSQLPGLMANQAWEPRALPYLAWLSSSPVLMTAPK